MKRLSFPITRADGQTVQKLLLQACAQSSHAAFLDSNNHHSQYSRFHWLAALGAHELLTCQNNCFEKLNEFRDLHQDWLIGHITYDLKNDLEALETRHEDSLAFPRLQFFIPDTIVYQNDSGIFAESLIYKSEEELLAALPAPENPLPAFPEVQLSPRTTREEYLQKVASLQDHLQYGNIYEINYCVEFSAHVPTFDPVSAFQRLNESSRAPFAAFYRSKDQYLLCASPERYLQKSGSRIISQPIKGTAPRSADPATDARLKDELRHSEKEQSENVMITDLVRNDLSRTAAKASVKVDELFGVYTFNTVHQMISTVSSELHQKFGPEDVLKTSFPMGSMTGAPKVRAMKLIDEHENFARSLYAGSVGYISPSGDFDFNVVIRSLLYNSHTGYLSARVGSAITIHCQAEKEYDECLLKAENLFNSLQNLPVSVH